MTIKKKLSIQEVISLIAWEEGILNAYWGGLLAGEIEDEELALAWAKLETLAEIEAEIEAILFSKVPESSDVRRGAFKRAGG